MDGYISKDELLRDIFNLNVAESHSERCSQLLEAILNAPVIDVVPKSDLDTLKSLITQKEEEAYNKGYADAKAEVAREIFEEIAIIGVLQHGFNDKHIVMHIDFELLKELKKKYIGG